jgi:hypothetical protein
MKFKVVGGFPSAANVLLAMERGEVEGICVTGLTNLRPDWISAKTVNVLFQGGAASRSALKGVPFVVDLAKTPEQRAAIDFCGEYRRHSSRRRRADRSREDAAGRFWQRCRTQFRRRRAKLDVDAFTHPHRGRHPQAYATPKSVGASHGADEVMRGYIAASGSKACSDARGQLTSKVLTVC